MVGFMGKKRNLDFLTFFFVAYDTAYFDFDYLKFMLLSCEICLENHILEGCGKSNSLKNKVLGTLVILMDNKLSNTIRIKKFHLFL